MEPLCNGAIVIAADVDVTFNPNWGPRVALATGYVSCVDVNVARGMSGSLAGNNRHVR